MKASDIGGFSLHEPSFEGTQRSRARGLFEHGLRHFAYEGREDMMGRCEVQPCGVPQGREGWGGNGVKNPTGVSLIQVFPLAESSVKLPTQYEREPFNFSPFDFKAGRCYKKEKSQGDVEKHERSI